MELTKANHLKMNWNTEVYPEILSVSIGQRPAEFEAFGIETVKAAQEIVDLHKEDGIALLLDESYESAVTLLSFLKTGIKFSVYYIDFLNLNDDQKDSYYRLIDWAKLLGVETKPIPFDFNRDDQLKALEKLQEYPLNSYPDELFKIWASCHIDEFLVNPGTFSFPIFNDDSTLKRWLLPDARHFGLMNFFERFGGVPFFMSYSPELIYSQIESFLSTQLLALAKKDRRIVSRASVAIKQMFAEQAFPKLSELILADIMYPVQMAAINNCDRETRDKFFSFVKRIPKSEPQIVQNVSSRFDLSDNLNFNNHHSARLLAISERTDIRGNAIEAQADLAGHQALAMFPVLTTIRHYEGDMKHALDVVKSLQYFRAPKSASTNPELHLNDKLKDLMSFFTQSVELYLKEMKYIYSGFDIVQCWANRYQLGHQYEHFHTHPNCLLSGVFYLTSGGGGSTVFKSLRRHQIMPNMKRLNHWNSIACEIAPEAGKLLLFPADIDHNTKPHGDADNPKYTIAFNVMFRP